MSKQWLFCMSPLKDELEIVDELITKYAFLSRTAYANRKGNPTFVSNVRAVNFKDTIHIYYRFEETLKEYGAFLVCGPNKHSQGAQFAGMVPKTALLRVKDSALLNYLTTLEDYEPDRQVGRYTGWGLIPLEGRSPTFRPEYFRGRRSIVEYNNS